MNGFESVLTKTKTWKQALDDVAMSLSKLGMQQFINSPIQQSMGNFMNGSGFQPNAGYGAGAMGMVGGLGSLFGLTGGGSSFLPSVFGGQDFSGAADLTGTALPIGGDYSAYHSGGIVGPMARRDAALTPPYSSMRSATTRAAWYRARCRS